MKSSLSVILGLALASLALTACSSSSSPSKTDGGPTDAGHDSGHDVGTVDTGPPPCMDSQCYTGNKCLPDSTGNVQCQLPCNLQPGQPPGGVATPGQTPSACPFNYTCTDFPAGTPAGSADRAYCTPDSNQVKTGPGLWGAPCDPGGGIETNPACDFAQNFWCNAKDQEDGDAYCTQYQCTTDSDCAGGWWCGTANLSPNAQSDTRSTGTTIRVCLPRDYCSTCKADVDCDSPTGIPEHCIADKMGANFCSPQCTENANCNDEAECLLTSDLKTPCTSGSQCSCYPRAGQCVGDGQLCSPCLSDGDCKAAGGLCLHADYSTELFCGVASGPSKPTCSVTEGTLPDGGISYTLNAACPTTDEAPNSPNITCLTRYDSIFDPANQCVGLVTIGADAGYPAYVLGCWTPSR